MDTGPSPLVSSLAMAVAEDGSVIVEVPVSGNADSLSYRITMPSHGVVTGTGPKFTYNPVSLYVGADRFVITVSDGERSTDVPVTLTIYGVNHAPAAGDQSLAIDENHAIQITLGAAQVDGNALTYQIVTAPAHGAFAGTAPGSNVGVYTPDAHHVGADAFTFTASDGTLVSNLGTVTIQIASKPVCGDGYLEGGEACDDGNQVDTDACRNDCSVAVCGDGVVQAGVEACDDGNADNTDACLDTCQVAACGDGFVQANVEDCDDGNTKRDDGCSSTCGIEKYRPDLLLYRFDETGSVVTNRATTPPVGTAMATVMGGVHQGAGGTCQTALIGSGVTASTDYLDTHWVTSLSGMSWTISFWTNGIAASPTLFYIFGDATAGTFRCFTNGVAGAGNWILRGTGMTDVYVNGGATVVPHMTTFVYDMVAGKIFGYLDGALVTSVTQAGPVISGTGPFKVSGYGTNVGLGAGAMFQEFRLFGRALSVDDVAGLYAVSSVCQ